MPHVIFFHGHDKFPKFNCFFLKKISRVVENSKSTQVRQQYLRCNYTKFQFKILIFLAYVLNFPRVSKFFAKLTIGMIGNEAGHLLECLKRYGTFINKSET